jgi:hypothetical protein
MSGRVQTYLKSQNMKWLIPLAALDLALVALLAAPEELVTRGSISEIAAARAGAASLLPLVVLLLTGVLPDNIKAALVHWRIRGVMPGSHAFTHHAPADVRINMAALKRNVGALPTDPAEQNAKWYELYCMVNSVTAVMEANRSYLLYRDMAAMSFLLTFLVPLGLRLCGAASTTLLASALIFAAQYAITAVSASHAGVRLVRNVLAIHAAQKIAA